MHLRSYNGYAGACLFKWLSMQQMPECHDGMAQYHARTAPSHHRSYALPHPRAVAMYHAMFARWL